MNQSNIHGKGSVTRKPQNHDFPSHHEPITPIDSTTYSNTPISKAMKGGQFRKNRMLKLGGGTVKRGSAENELNSNSKGDFIYANLPEM